MKLTKRVVDALKPSPEGETFAWDSELKGFGVRMQPSGVASFILKYRTSEGRQRKLALGRVGSLTPDEARNIARRRLVEVTQGADPSAERQKIRQAITVAELCDHYLVEAAGRIKASTLAMDKSRVERHVKPLIGRITVQSLTAQDVSRLQSDIVAGRSAADREGRGGVTTGGKGVASRTVGMVGAILEFAKRRNLIKSNVARGIERPADGRQRRFLSLAEIGRLGKAVSAAAEEGEGETAIAAIKFALLTGCRRMEVLSLPMAWVDREGSCIRFRDTKSGYQIRPIGPEAFKILDSIQHRNGWAFPAARGKEHFVGLPKVLSRLCERAELEGITVHVLRHSFAAMAAGMGFSELTIAGLLGHQVSGVTARYAHVPDSALVLAATEVSERISDALAGKATDQRADQNH